MEATLIEEIRDYVYRHGLNAAVERYADPLARWPGEPTGIWLRVSSGKQDEANQLPEVLSHCAGRGLRPTKWYIVHGKSAYHGKHQDDLNHALTDMRNHEISALVIWHSDRIERRPGKALLDVLVEFGDAGGRVESVQEPTLGQLDFDGQVTTFIAGLVNYEKSKHIAEHTKLAQDRIRANNATANRVPWGYETIGPKYNRTLVPTDIGRKYVPQIFQRCIAGESLRTIAAWLDSGGVPPVRGEQWHEGSLRHIIMNRTYTGRRIRRGDGKEETFQTCEPIINADVFDRANKALRNRPKRGPVAKEPGKRSMLAKLRCYRCGSPMYRITAGDGTARVYYRCTGSGPQRKGCGNRVPFDRLERMVAVRMLAWNDAPYQTKEWAEGKNWDAEIADTLQSIRELNPLEDPDYSQHHAELIARLNDYKNRDTIPGHWECIDVLNADGSVMTIGQHFFDLDKEGRREYLMGHDIRAERPTCCGGIRVVIDGREDIAHKEGCADSSAEI